MVYSGSLPPTQRPSEAATASLLPPASHSPWAAYQKARAPGSKAHANLRKIVAIITNVLPPLSDSNALRSQLDLPPPPPLASLEVGGGASRVFSAPSERYGMPMDLQLRLGPSSVVGRRMVSRDDEDDHETGFPRSSCSAVGEGTTKLTEAGGGSSAVAVLETAESEIVSASYDGSHGSGTLDSNSSEEGKSFAGEWDARVQVGGQAGEKETNEARAEVGEEEQAREEAGGELREARPCSEITTIGENPGGFETEEGDGNKDTVGRFSRPRTEVREKKKSRTRDGDNERSEDGCLGLLLEAVRQISGGMLEDDENRRELAHPRERKEEIAKSSNERHCATVTMLALEPCDVVMAGDEALEPVVRRSKRGRSQALPSRYRDSVLEPWRKHSGGGGGHNRQSQRRQARTSR